MNNRCRDRLGQVTHPLLRGVSTSVEGRLEFQLGVWATFILCSFTSFHIHSFMLSILIYFYVIFHCFAYPMGKGWGQHSCTSSHFLSQSMHIKRSLLCSVGDNGEQFWKQSVLNLNSTLNCVGITIIFVEFLNHLFFSGWLALYLDLNKSAVFYQ